MKSFLGEHEIVIDGSGRFNVPASIKGTFEDHYGSEIVISYRDNCLIIYPQKVWEKEELEIKAKHDAQEKAGRMARLQIFRNATVGKIKSGKISLPQKQRERANIQLKEEAMLFGSSDCLVVWSKIELAKEEA